MYLSATATGSSDNQLFDIGYGNYSSADSESKANYKWYAQTCLVSQNSKFTLNSVDVEHIVFINYNDVLLKDRINISNYSLTMGTNVYTPDTAQTNTTGISPLCGRSRYLLSASVHVGWLLYDKKLAILDGAKVS